MSHPAMSEYNIFRSHFAFIRQGILGNLDDLVPKLFEKALIESGTNSAASNLSLTGSQRATTVMEVLDRRIYNTPGELHKFLTILDELPALSYIAEKLRQQLPQPYPHPRPSHLTELVGTQISPAAYSPQHPLVYNPAPYGLQNMVYAYAGNGTPVAYRSSASLSSLATPSPASPQPPSLDELIEGYEIPAALYQSWCSDGFLANVSAKMSDFRKSACSHLSISNVTICDISNMYAQNPQRQRLELLKKWRDKFAFKATYENLIRCFWSAGREDLANIICVNLVSMSSSQVSDLRPTSIQSETVGVPSTGSARDVGLSLQQLPSPAMSPAMSPGEDTTMPFKNSGPKVLLPDRTQTATPTSPPDDPQNNFPPDGPLPHFILDGPQSVSSDTFPDDLSSGLPSMEPVPASDKTQQLLSLRTASIDSYQSFVTACTHLSLQSQDSQDGESDETLLEEMNGITEKCRLRLIKKEKLVQKLRHKLEEKSREVQTAEERTKEAEVSLKNLREELTRRDQELKEQDTKTVAMSKGRHDCLQKELKLAEEYLSEMEVDRDTLTEELSHVQEEKERLTRQCQTLKTELHRVKRELVKAQSQSFHYERDNVKLREKVHDLEVKIDCFLENCNLKVVEKRRHSVP